MNIPNKHVILHFTKFSFVFSNNILCFNTLLDNAFKLICKKLHFSLKYSQINFFISLSNILSSMFVILIFISDSNSVKWISNFKDCCSVLNSEFCLIISDEILDTKFKYFSISFS